MSHRYTVKVWAAKPCENGQPILLSLHRVEADTTEEAAHLALHGRPVAAGAVVEISRPHEQ